VSAILTEEQRALQETAAAYLAQHANAREGRDGDQALWQGIAELGWTAVIVPEAFGGLGLGLAEAAVLLEESGRQLTRSPLFSAVALTHPLLVRCATEAACQRLLPALAEGRGIATVIAGPGLSPFVGAAGLEIQARRDGDGWVLDGTAPQVLDGDTADTAFVVARLDEGGMGLFEVPAGLAGVTRSPLAAWDLSRPQARWQLEGVRLGAEARLDAPGALDDGLSAALATTALLLAAEQVGGAARCIELTVAYTRAPAVRPAGGRLPGRQAPLRRDDGQARGARSALGGALAACAGLQGALALDEIAVARVQAAEAYRFCAAEAIQLHGGVGFTWEYDPQLHFKRAQWGRQWFGTPDAWRDAVADSLLGRRNAHDDDGRKTFRAEVADWMARHLTGRFEVLRHRGGPGDETAHSELRREWEQVMASGGWIGLGWPRAHGGRELPVSLQVAFHEEYARAGGPGRMGHIGETLMAPTLIDFGTPEQQQRFLPGIREGKVFWCQGYSEPGAGSDLAAIRTRCWLEDGKWHLQGQKVWTSLAHESEWIFVIARSTPGSVGRDGLSFLLVPLDQPGVEIRPIRQMTGEAEFNEVFFDGACTAADCIVGAPGDGWKVAMALLGYERGLSTLGQQMHFSHELQLLVDAARACGADQDLSIRRRIADAWIGLRTLRANALRIFARGEAAVGRRRWCTSTPGPTGTAIWASWRWT
jgi:alkylation response protein AidB-like acyl-CoA dehydrogenase